MSVPPDKMTARELEARIRFHESTSAMYDQMREPLMSRAFHELAQIYRDELERRGIREPLQAPSEAEPQPQVVPNMKS